MVGSQDEPGTHAWIAVLRVGEDDPAGGQFHGFEQVLEDPRQAPAHVR